VFTAKLGPTDYEKTRGFALSMPRFFFWGTAKLTPSLRHRHPPGPVQGSQKARNLRGLFATKHKGIARKWRRNQTEAASVHGYAPCMGSWKMCLFPGCCTGGRLFFSLVDYC